MDNPYLLPVFATIQRSWHKLKGSKVTFWGAYGWMFLLLFALGFTTGMLGALHYPGLRIPTLTLMLITRLLSFILCFGLVRLGVRRAFDQPIQAAMIFDPLKRVTLILKLLGCWLLYLVILLPYAMLVILVLVTPPISSHAAMASQNDFIFLSFSFALFWSVLLSVFLLVRVRLCWAFILDKDLGPWQAMVQSFDVTHDNFWRLVGLAILNFLILIVSILPLGLGLIWSLPYLLINYGQVYRQMVEKKD